MSLSKKGLLSLPFKIYCCWKLENVSNLFYLLALMLQECNQTFPPITQERLHAIFWPSCSIPVDPSWSQSRLILVDLNPGWSQVISILVDPGWFQSWLILVDLASLVDPGWFQSRLILVDLASMVNPGWFQSRLIFCINSKIAKISASTAQPIFSS